MNTKWKIASVAALGVFVPGAVYAGVLLNVNNHSLSHLKPDAPSASFVEKGINNQNIAKVYNLSQARAVASFPIREPESISGWNHTDSQGFLWKHLKSATTGVDAYYDVYTNRSGQQVTVQQLGSLDANVAGHNPDGSKIQFGSDNYKADLYTTSSSGQKELLIQVKEPNNTLTYIEIAGSASADDLQTIGHDYLAASSK